MKIHYKEEDETRLANEHKNLISDLEMQRTANSKEYQRGRDAQMSAWKNADHSWQTRTEELEAELKRLRSGSIIRQANCILNSDAPCKGLAYEQAEIQRLKHDIKRSVATCAELATDNERLRELAKVLAYSSSGVSPQEQEAKRALRDYLKEHP
jgi:hypothetical protein